MRDALSVDHVRLHRHRQGRPARPDLGYLHAEALAGVVFPPHRVRAGAREIIGDSVALTFTRSSLVSGSDARRSPKTALSHSSHLRAGLLEQAS